MVVIDDPVTFTFSRWRAVACRCGLPELPFPCSKESLSTLSPNLALQTNLWFLTPELAEVLAECEIPRASSPLTALRTNDP